MKLNIIFLIIGLAFSMVSKVNQFKLKNTALGNLLIFPAASFLCLAVLFSLGKYTALLSNPASQGKAVWMAVLACAAIASFQLMMLTIIDRHSLYGILLVVPFLLFAGIFIRLWIF